MSLDPDRRRIDEEMAHHLVELEAHLEAQGMTRDEARAEARLRFGDPDLHARRAAPHADSEWRRRIETVRQDLQHGLRQMRRHPLTHGLAVLTLAVGVAAATVVYSVVHAVALAPLPFAEPDRVVHVSQTSPQGRLYSMSEPNFVDFRGRQQSFEEMAAMGWVSPVLTGMGDPVSIDARRVSHTFFGVLGISPVLGRDFLPEEDRFGGTNDVALLSEGAWRRRFAEDRSVIGQTIVLDGTAHEIVGVVPSDDAWPGVEVFTPLAPNPDYWRDDQRLETLARLAPGVTLEEAGADMSEIAARLSEEYPDSNDGWGARVSPAREWLIGDRLTVLGRLLLGAVGLFLLMACASISNLLVARASARIREMGVRTALGASGSRIASQLLTEAGLVATAGAFLAWILADRGLRLAQAFGPGDIARLADASLDGRALAVGLGATLFTVALAALAPIVLLTRADDGTILRSGTRGGFGGSHRVRSGLVVAQFALAVTVISGAGLLGRSFGELMAVDIGFDAAAVVAFTVRLPDDRFDQQGRAEYLELLESELMAIPGVQAVGGTTAPPFSPMAPSNFVARSDQEPDRQQDFLPVSWRAVTSGYFEAAGIPVLAGRDFEGGDIEEQDLQNPPVVIDRSLADQLFPGEDPVGRFVTWFLPGGQQCRIIGVVATARDERLDREPRPRIYRRFTFSASDQPAVLVRTEGDPATSIPLIREATLRVDASTPAIDPTVLADDLRRTVAWPRFSMQVLGLFGLVALLLAAMGIYGVTAFSVACRRHEIGVRLALGAEPAGIHWMVARGTLRLALAGIGVGLATALGMASFLGTLLYEVSRTDPFTFLTVPFVVGIVAILATWIPARRALHLDPGRTLTGS